MAHFRKVIVDERHLLKIASHYAGRSYLYFRIGNAVELSSNLLTQIMTDNSVGRACVTDMVFFSMLLRAYSYSGSELFNKLYDGFEGMDLEYDYKSFLTNNNMNCCLPSI